MRMDVLLLSIISMFAAMNVAEATPGYKYEYSIPNSSGTEVTYIVTPEAGNNFLGNNMEFIWKVGSVEICRANIRITGNSVTDYCNIPADIKDKSVSVTTIEKNNNDPVNTDNNPNEAIIIKAGNCPPNSNKPSCLPEFGKTGPVISIFLIGAAYLYFRRRPVEK